MLVGKYVVWGCALRSWVNLPCKARRRSKEEEEETYVSVLLPSLDLRPLLGLGWTREESEKAVSSLSDEAKKIPANERRMHANSCLALVLKASVHFICSERK